MNQETVEAVETAPAPLFVWTRWKVITFSLAGLLVVAGAVLAATSGGTTGAIASDESLLASGPAGAPATGAGARGLLPGTTTGGTTGGTTGETTGGTDEPGAVDPSPTVDESGNVTWSPALLRGGISFFAAFALAFAFRSFLKIALIIVGLWAGAMFYLSYLGWIEVHWDIIDAAFNAMTANVGEQFKSVQTFITGSLPSAGMGGLGLYTGFRRK